MANEEQLVILKQDAAIMMAKIILNTLSKGVRVVARGDCSLFSFFSIESN